ncbi:hypothetical protein BDV98DRAFT_401335 [Pterulicium gracile]|uniref:Fungal pheromone mating factor STE2 GPCR-domain-containing protein n=1 Tax=Pterulicium gracile TaxID=1884261 RepID=A0A5C3PZW5_9AGAR|nr:hypothetical protein BDV98DRAFT_401335 [Pterula gracilis]
MDSTGLESDSDLDFDPELAAGLLLDIGKDVKFGLKVITAELVFYGFYFLLAGIAVHTLITRPRPTSTRTIVLISALALTFLTTTIFCGLDIGVLFANVQKNLIDNAFLSFDARAHYFDDRVHCSTATNMMQILMSSNGNTGILFLINDSLAIWRALSVWHSSSRLIIGMLLYCLVFWSFVLWIPMILIRSGNLNMAAADTQNMFSILATVASILSIAANAFATGMIGYTAYVYSFLQDPQYLRTASCKILSLIAESGFLYGIIQIIRLSLDASVVPKAPRYDSILIAATVFNSATTVIAAMYIPALIIIVNHGYSVSEVVPVERRRSKMGDIESKFAARNWSR